ncbi:MAG: hypothetical protein ACI4EN_01585 [Butyrivibrio sp.]
MFCIYCGRPLKDNEVCNCRGFNTYNLNTTDSYNSQYNYVDNRNNYNFFDESWKSNRCIPAVREVLNSPATVITAVLLTVSFAIKLIGGMDFDILLLLNMIGAWIVNSVAKKTNRKFSTSGLSIISGVMTVNIVALCIVFAVLIPLLIGCIYTGKINDGITYVFRMFNDNYNGYTVELTTLANISLCVISLALFWFILYYYVSFRGNIVYIKKAVSDTPGKGKFTAFPNVISIIYGILCIAAGIGIFCAGRNLTAFINREFAREDAMMLNILSIGLRFAYPCSAILSGIVRIIAGIKLNRLRTVFKNSELM